MGLVYSYGLENVIKITDATTPISLIFFILVLFVMIKEKKIFKFQIMDMLILLLISYSLLIGIFTSTALETIQFIFYSCIFYFFGRFIILDNSKVLKQTIFLFSSIIIVALIFQYVSNSQSFGRVMLNNANPIGLGELLTILSLTSYYTLRFEFNKNSYKLLYIFFFLLSLFCQIVIISSRGAIITTFLTIVLAEGIFFKSYRIITSSGIVLFLYGLFNYFNEQLSMMFPLVSRFSVQSLLNSQSIFGSSTSIGRVDKIRETLISINSKPFIGSGFGKFYPHNIILEIWSSIGLVGLLIFITILLYLSRIIVRIDNNICKLIAILLIAIIINRMMSFNYTAYKNLFLLTGMLLSNYKLMKDGIINGSDRSSNNN
ncbi:MULTISPECIES: O-antigen ligase family protein [Enterococcus]|nr:MULTISPECIES: O-antigen ligase family protein [Enterococcus]EJV43447.1 O-antigen polymerase [Enterococcus faecium TX1337RF]